jgi:hypothetical protein
MSLPHMLVVSSYVMAYVPEMIEWLVECFPEQEEEIRECEPWEICFSIRKYYHGGVDAFIRASDP